MINTIAPHGPPTQIPQDRPTPGGKGGDAPFDDFLPGKPSAGTPWPIDDHSPPATLPAEVGDEVPPEPVRHRPIRLKNATGTGTEPAGTDAVRAAMLLPTPVDPPSPVPTTALSLDGMPSAASETSASSDETRPGSPVAGTAGADLIRPPRDPSTAADRLIRPGAADEVPGGGSGQVIDGTAAGTDDKKSDAVGTRIPVTDWIRAPYSSGTIPETESTAMISPVTPPVDPTLPPYAEEIPVLPPRLPPIVQFSPENRLTSLPIGAAASRVPSLPATVPVGLPPAEMGPSDRLPVSAGETDLARGDRATHPGVETRMPPGIETDAPTHSSPVLPDLDPVGTGRILPVAYSISTSRAVLPSPDTRAPVASPVPDSRLTPPNLSTVATPDRDLASTSTANLPGDPTGPMVGGSASGTATTPSFDADSSSSTPATSTPQAENSSSSDDDKAKIAASSLPEIRSARNLGVREMQAAEIKEIKSDFYSSGTPVAKRDAVVTATSPTEEKEIDQRPLPKRSATGLSGASVPARRADVGTSGSEALVSSAVAGVTTSSAANFHVAETTAPDSTAARQVVKVETLLQNAMSAGEGLRPNGQSQLEMRVRLGNGSEDVTVRMQVANDRMQVTFQTDSPEMRKALEHGWEQFSSGAAQNSSLSLAPAQFEPGRAFAAPQSGQADAQTSFSGQQNSRRQDETAFSADESVTAGSSTQPGRANTSIPIPAVSRGASRRWSGWA